MDSMFENRIDLSALHKAAEQLKQEMAKVIVGQSEMVELILAAILADGHVLIEGVPGVAKTLTAKLTAAGTSADFSRIQFTPDLMPSDVIGTSIFNTKTSEFEFRKGPVFSNIVLIDEINRAPAKTQSALFEAMEERQITVDGTTYHLPPPFMVLATQNPIEQEGTYRLPEAQLDRFLFKINVNYPTLDEETKILTNAHVRKGGSSVADIVPVLSKEEIVYFRQKTAQLHVEEPLLKYIAQITIQTRQHSALYMGASPRASLAMMQGSKAIAALRGRDFVTPEDIRYVAEPVLRHRLMLTPEREMDGTTIGSVIKQILDSVEVPR
jgi:MoxR-like ATPase